MYPATLKALGMDSDQERVIYHSCPPGVSLRPGWQAGGKFRICELEVDKEAGSEYQGGLRPVTVSPKCGLRVKVTISRMGVPSSETSTCLCIQPVLEYFMSLEKETLAPTAELFPRPPQC